MNKKIGVLPFALTFSGCLLGAGFVSGQELWQYFGSYGFQGLLGVMVSLLLLAISTFILLRFAFRVQSTTVEPLIIAGEHPLLRLFFGLLTAVMVLCVGTIMIAGISALFEQSFGFPAWICGLFITLLVGLFVCHGLGAMVSLFSTAVPILIIVTLVICFIQICNGSWSLEFQNTNQQNALLGNWFLSSINYACVNYFSFISILVPLASNLKKKTTLPFGLMIGSVALFVVALGIIGSMIGTPFSTSAQIPMASVASGIGSFAIILYALLLFLGMFGNAVSSLVSAVSYINQKWPGTLKYHKIIIMILCLLCYIASLLGFGDLISVAYPVFGYMGMLIMALIMINYIRILIKGDRT